MGMTGRMCLCCVLHIVTPTSFTRIRDFEGGEDKLDISQRGAEVVRKTAFGDHTVLWLGPTNTKVLALLRISRRIN